MDKKEIKLSNLQDAYEGIYPDDEEEYGDETFNERKTK